MTKIFLLTILFSSLANATWVGYGYRNCDNLNEDRGEIKGKEACRIRYRCEKYMLANPDRFSNENDTAFCAPLPSGRCKSPEKCIDDQAFAASDIKYFKKHDKVASSDESTNETSDDPCNCDCRNGRSTGRRSAPSRNDSTAEKDDASSDDGSEARDIPFPDGGKPRRQN